SRRVGRRSAGGDPEAARTQSSPFSWRLQDMTGGEALLERDAELDRLRGAILAARDGTGGLALIEGPAGIGKTSLLLAARAMAQDVGMLTLLARGRELEREFAFGVGRQLFE